MSKTIIFHGVNALDFEELRKSAIRIPEVIGRIRQAQRLWDKAMLPEFDFLNFLSSDDELFLNNIQLKSLAAAVVQIGLYDRFIAKSEKPNVLVGDKKGDSPLLVCSGRMSFADMLYSSKAIESLSGSNVSKIEDRALLAGMTVESLSVFLANEEKPNEYIEVNIGHVNLSTVVRLLVDEYEQKEFVNVGPGSNLEKVKYEFAMEELRFSESIDGDPMLNWFFDFFPCIDYKMAQ